MNMEGLKTKGCRLIGNSSIDRFDDSGPKDCLAGMRFWTWGEGAFADRLVRTLTVWLAGVALLGVYASIAASQEKPKAAVVAQDKKPHPPLFGKACADCHKHEVSANVRCLIAKEPMCVLCHDIPDSGGNAKLVNMDSPLCLKCHAREKFKGSYGHGPFVFGACVACHDPHGGGEARMLRFTGRQTCLTCHRDMDARFTNAAFRHKALASGCTDCHSPHTSDQRYELKEPVPILCSRCHEQTFRDHEMAKVKHSPVTEKRSCMNCHDPHLAQADRLLVSEEWDLCLKCHDESIKIGQYELERIGPLLAANPNHHGPLQNKECSECHQPHGSAHFRLLTDEYPEKVLVPFMKSKYELCFRCHEPTLVTEERTETLTGFRDGNHNLHFAHVNKLPTGRACRLCHLAHASTLPKHIGVTVRFGSWDMPLRFSKTENGGSCSPGCHSVKKYERKAG
jgi:predicted CXXCH cytochrome family protein